MLILTPDVVKQKQIWIQVASLNTSIEIGNFTFVDVLELQLLLKQLSELQITF